MVWIIAMLALSGLFSGAIVEAARSVFDHKHAQFGHLDWLPFLALAFGMAGWLGTLIALKVGSLLPVVLRKTQEVALISHAPQSPLFLIRRGAGDDTCYYYVEALKSSQVEKVKCSKTTIFEQDGMKIGILRKFRLDFASPLHWLLGMVWGVRYEFYIPSGGVSRRITEEEWKEAIVPPCGKKQRLL